MKIDNRGVGFVEILVCVVILSIVISGVTSIMAMGFYFMKQAEHKSKAMDIACYEMSKAMSRSYTATLPIVDLNRPVILSAAEDDGTDYFLSTIIEEGTLAQASNLGSIPYKNITMECSYQDRKINKNLSSLKKVRMTNMIAYPYVHTLSFASDSFLVENPIAGTPVIPIGSTDSDYVNIAKDINNNPIEIPLNYAVTKDVIVNYNIAINPISKTYLLPPNALVKTRCTLDNAPIGTIETGTPIITQLFICNQIVIKRLEPKPSGEDSILRLQWYRESGNPALDDATVFLRKCEVTVRAYESQ